MDIRTPGELGAVARGRRRALGLSQVKVAEAAGVSRVWLAEFENGKPTVELGRVLAVLTALELIVDVSAPGEAVSKAAPELDLDSLMEEYNREPHDRD
ncbi:MULTISPECIES: helix-turn-helix domain-containing protein [unclassified Kribbella]|uniref:helix-turn-helix domain-containing protein n=1 Tax=unclassified Kribbella TaxID=2644121 RepID=UPI003016827F